MRRLVWQKPADSSVRSSSGMRARASATTTTDYNNSSGNNNIFLPVTNKVNCLTLFLNTIH